MFLVKLGERQAENVGKEIGAPLLKSAMMTQAEVVLQNYDRDRRKVQRRVGYVLLVLLPLPVLLFKAHASSLVILCVALVPALVLGVIVPIVYRRRYHPDHGLKSERRFTALALICRPLGFVLGVVALVAMAMDSPAASHTGIASALAGVIVFAIPQLLAKRSIAYRAE